jgi:hypothetical protein
MRTKTLKIECQCNRSGSWFETCYQMHKTGPLTWKIVTFSCVKCKLKHVKSPSHHFTLWPYDFVQTLPCLGVRLEQPTAPSRLWSKNQQHPVTMEQDLFLYYKGLDTEENVTETERLLNLLSVTRSNHLRHIRRKLNISNIIAILKTTKTNFLQNIINMKTNQIYQKSWHRGKKKIVGARRKDEETKNYT